MIRIDEITRGRFGNRVLQYNSLCQLSNMLCVDASCVNWEGHDVFCDLFTYKSEQMPVEQLGWLDLCDLDEKNLSSRIENTHLSLDYYALHNCFFQLTHVAPNKFLKIRKDRKINLDSSFIHVGIHIRGGDVLDADGGREIHDYRYYIDSINFVDSTINEKKVYHVCSDDTTFETFNKVVEFLKLKGHTYFLGPAVGNQANHIKDFLTLCECDILISSSSTYCIAAAIVDKKKKVIHSKAWMDKNIQGTSYWKWIDRDMEKKI